MSDQKKETSGFFRKKKNAQKNKNKKNKNRAQIGFHRVRNIQASRLHGHILSKMESLDSKKVIGVRIKNEFVRTTIAEPDYSMASAMMNPNEVYTFKLQGFSTVSSNGSGIIAVSVPFDPSSGGFNFSEWTDLAALFDEVKLSGFRVQVCSFANTTATDVFSPLVIATNLVSSSAPGSEGAVATLTDACYHPSNMTNASGFVHSFKNNGVIGWSSTASVTDQPYAGCPGSFQIYVNNFSVSTLAFKVLVQGFYNFRARS